MPSGNPVTSYDNRPAVKLAIIWHEYTVPADPQDAPPDSDECDRFGSDYDSEDSDAIYGIYGHTGMHHMMGSGSRRSETPPQAVRFGLPQVIVMDPSWQKGGLEADRHVKRVSCSLTVVLVFSL